MSGPSSNDDLHKSPPIDLGLFIDSVVDYAIISLDVNGKVASWNTGARRLKGYTADEIIGQHFSKFYIPSEREAGVPQRLLRKAETEGHVEHTGWRVRNDGTRFWGDVIISAVRNADGELLGFAKVVRDLTERRLSEEREKKLAADLARANQMKSEFLANMSHEIRTPLNGIIGMLTLLLDSELTPTQRDLAQTAQGSSGALLRIVNDILDFSKVEAGRMELESEPFSINEVIRDVCSLFEPQARAKNIELLMTVDTSMPEHVLGDAGRLRQVIANLVGNGVKFTTAGSVHIVARSRRSTEGRVIVRFEVIDTGVGIDDSDASRLFEAFAQADPSTTRLFGGTGLGLAISQRLIALMGGSIGVQSEVDKGSTFYFEVDFPVAVPGDDRASTSRMLDSSIPSKPRAVRRGRILLAEDNEVNQQVAAMFLERLGFDVNVVANGQEAVDALEREPFDAVLMDCQMPVMDGFQATAKIREMSGSVGRIPIIAVTASAMPQERDKCLAAGMDDFVSKPVFPDALNEVLVNALANRKRMQSPSYSASLSEILGGDMSLLIDVYAKSTAEQLEKMTEALELHDLQTAAIAAHSMKGASATIALDEMAEIARRIETAVKEGDRDTAIDLCNVAKAMSVDVVDKLRAEYS